MNLLARLRAFLAKRDPRMFQPTDSTRMDPTFIADLKAEAEHNAGNPYPHPAPDYCDVAWAEGKPDKPARVAPINRKAMLRGVK